MEESALDPNGVPIARTLNSLGAILGDLGQLAKARTHLDRAKRILEGAGSGSSHHLAEVLRDLAHVLSNSGRPDQAVELCEEAIEIETERLGPRHPGRARSFMELGSARREINLLQQAMGAYRTALNILREHPKRSAVALCRRGMGETMLARGDHHGARGEVEGAIALQRDALPEKHPELAKSYEVLADIFKQLELPEEAAAARAAAQVARP
jgi:tetratricopeptide (TPR) repeat protein